MRNLWLSSLVLILINCAPAIHKDLKKSQSESQSIVPVFNQGKSYLYKAKIDILTHYLSGLLFIKPTAKDTFRLVFTNELGVKFFDIEYFPKGSTVHYVMEKLDRKVVLKTLEKDMKLFLMSDLNLSEKQGYVDSLGNQNIFRFKGKKEFFYYFLNKEKQIVRIENTSKKKVKVAVDLRNYKNYVPYFINIRHYAFKFNIELNYLER